MYRARIYVENIRLTDLCKVADEYFKQGYVVIGCASSRNGKHTPTIIFEILRDTIEQYMRFAVEDFISDIKPIVNMESIVYTLEEVRIRSI